MNYLELVICNVTYTIDMHAYLIVGKDVELVKAQVEKLAGQMGAKISHQMIKTIADVRELNKFSSMSFAEPTVIVINDFDNVTEEASNAFLKSLEEPAEGVGYILTTRSIHSLLPTVVSRCIVVRIGGDGGDNSGSRKSAIDFINSDLTKMFEQVDGIKSRDEALEFVQQLIEGLHAELVDNENNNNSSLANALEAANDTLESLNKNGNVNLQLTNLVVSIN